MTTTTKSKQNKTLTNTPKVNKTTNKTKAKFKQKIKLNKTKWDHKTRRKKPANQLTNPRIDILEDVQLFKII